MRLTELIQIFKEASELAQPDVNGINYQLIVQRHHILELTEKAEKMQKALEFYADSAHMINVDYEEFEAIPGNKDFIEQEHGLKARKVLAEVEK
jgi:hypothetical protein